MTTEHASPASTTAVATPVQFRLVTRYATWDAQPFTGGDYAVSYLVLRLADDSFVHISLHGHAPGEANPISSMASFAHFADDHAERRQGEMNQQQARLVGSYVTVVG